MGGVNSWEHKLSNGSKSDNMFCGIDDDRYFGH